MRHILLVANQTVVGTHVTKRVYELLEDDPDTHVFVVVPATPRTSEDGYVFNAVIPDQSGRQRANTQLAAAINSLRKLDITVRGEVGQKDPMAAVADVMARHSFDLILVSTLPLGKSRWLSMDLPHRLERRYGIPVEHLVGQPLDGWDDAPPKRNGPLNVLVIDDDRADTELIRESLTDSEFDLAIEVAPNGAQALEYVRVKGQNSIDLMLLDLKMPVIDGHEFLEQLGDEFDIDKLNVVVVTTSPAESDRKRAHALGAGAYVLKDPDFDVFSETLRSVIGEAARAGL